MAQATTQKSMASHAKARDVDDFGYFSQKWGFEEEHVTWNSALQYSVVISGSYGKSPCSIGKSRFLSNGQFSIAMLKNRQTGSRFLDDFGVGRSWVWNRPRFLRDLWTWSAQSVSPLPIGSMYGIYANIGGILMVNVTIHSIHGSYGL